MRASGYLKLIPSYRGGRVTGVRLGGTTKGFPSGWMEAGTLIVRVELDVDEALLNPRVLEGDVPPGAATIALEVRETEAA